MDHPIIEDLRRRHTAKKYDRTKRICEEDLQVLFEALRLSASSINSQPWRFVVIESDEARERMARTFGDKFGFNKAHVSDASQIILFAHHPMYSRKNYEEVVEKAVEDGRTEPGEREKAFGAFVFAEMNTEANGDTSCWTKAQLYLALGNAMHALARLGIDATPMEGIDAARVNEEFGDELLGYRCEVALAIGYHDEKGDSNAGIPKSRRRMESILARI